MKILHFDNIAEYCKGIGINEPSDFNFDIRRFEINMETVKTNMATFQHRLYAIALKLEGSGVSKFGDKIEKLGGAYLFFNSPYQLLSWEIERDWKGYYIIFTEQFIQSNIFFRNFLKDFPFLQLDKTIPLLIESESDKLLFIDIFERIYNEYHSSSIDRFEIISSYVNTILLYIRRYFKTMFSTKSPQLKNNDLKLLSRFQYLVESSFYDNKEFDNMNNPHTVTYYAKNLNVHPNYLNAVVKKLTGNTAINFIHKHIIHHAKSFLTQTDMSIKEIAYTLQFESPSNFNTLFKKLTLQTPISFRKSRKL